MASPSPSPSLQANTDQNGSGLRAQNKNRNHYDEEHHEDAFARSQRSSTNIYDTPRLILRNLPFEQSMNALQVHHNQGIKLYKLVRYDFFHVFLRLPTYQSTGILLFIWTFVICIFGGCYYSVDRQYPDVTCGLGPANHPISYFGAFAFSLETATTVGYGLPGPYNFFEKCFSLQTTIFFQEVWSMLFNAFLFAFFFSRLARHDARSIQVVFSKQAIVSIDPASGQVHFQVRVYDIDARHPVVEAHARLYAVRKDRPVPRPLRIIYPNDELNSVLFLSLPSVIHHQIDVYSLLHPPPNNKTAFASLHGNGTIDFDSSNISMYPVSAGLVLRQADSKIRGREECECLICGETFGTPDALIRHVQYVQKIERVDAFPVEGSHLSLDTSVLQKQKQSFEPTTNLEQLRIYFDSEISEVICMVEGIDPITSGTFQALQSYRCEDIVWDSHASFFPCLTAVHKKDSYSDDVSHPDDFFEVDLDRFHQIDYRDEPVINPPNLTVNASTINAESPQPTPTETAKRSTNVRTPSLLSHAFLSHAKDNKNHKTSLDKAAISSSHAAWNAAVIDGEPEESLTLPHPSEDISPVVENDADVERGFDVLSSPSYK